jgi:hypothetical protein
MPNVYLVFFLVPVFLPPPLDAGGFLPDFGAVFPGILSLLIVVPAINLVGLPGDIEVVVISNPP